MKRKNKKKKTKLQKLDGTAKILFCKQYLIQLQNRDRYLCLLEVLHSIDGIANDGS